MPRSYRHISNYEKEILELKSNRVTTCKQASSCDVFFDETSSLNLFMPFHLRWRYLLVFLEYWTEIFVCWISQILCSFFNACASFQHFLGHIQFIKCRKQLRCNIVFLLKYIYDLIFAHTKFIRHFF